MAILSFFRLGLAFVFLFLLLIQVTAHLELSGDDLAEYHRQIKRDSDALSNCLKSPAMQEHNARMLAHRDETLHRLRKARGIDPNIDLSKRDEQDRNKYSGVSHEEKPGHSQDPQDIFNFRWNESPHQYKGCALTPHSLYGPFWQEGQPWRQDVRAGERGIYLRLAMQVINIKTCLPMQGAQVDIWQADSLGKYSNLTIYGYLRGWQSTSYQGTVDFDTNFPGHYGGRTSHIHVSVRVGPSDRYVNAGQLYFDQKIVDEVNVAERYKGNTNGVIKNSEDQILGYDASRSFDPFVRWSRIGHSLEDGGLLGWTTLGVDPTNMNIHQPPDGDPHTKRQLLDMHLS